MKNKKGGSPRKRPFHCTSVGLTPAITPNVGNSGTQFISVGVCVRANPCKKRKTNNKKTSKLVLLPSLSDKCKDGRRLLLTVWYMFCLYDVRFCGSGSLPGLVIFFSHLLCTFGAQRDFYTSTWNEMHTFINGYMGHCRHSLGRFRL